MSGSAVTIQETDRVFRLIKPQADFIRSDARYPAYVAAWGTGKTTAAIGRVMRMCEMPGNLGLIGRQEFTDLKDSTIKDFQDYTGLKVDSQREVHLPNGSIIMFRHLEEMNNIQNINLGWFWIEQAEELDTDEIFFKLHGRLRRNVEKRSGFITANTNGHNWIYKLWKANKGSDADYALFEATSKDNSHNLPSDTVESWEKLKEKAPKVYKRFVLNSWDESDTTDIIISPDWIASAAKRSLSTKPPLRKIASIDVSRYGDDKTVIYGIENNIQIGKEEWEKKDTMETVGRSILFAKKHQISAFAVDEIGVGSGVADRLRELGHQVIFVNAAEREAASGFYNRRAEIYQKGADLFQNGLVQIDPSDTDLTEQLSWAKYKTIKSNGNYQVEAKEDIKKRYGRSPDNADAFLNGLWALPQVRQVVNRDKYSLNAVRNREPAGSFI